MAFSYHLEAEYESGYVHRETPEDLSPYAPTRNYFYDILHRVPVAFHGKMVRYSLVGPDQRYDMQNVRNMGTGEDNTTMLRQRFGYQFNDENGKNHKEVKEI